MGCTCVIAKPFASVAGTEEVQIPTTEAFDVLQRDRAASLPGGKTSSSTFGNNLRVCHVLEPPRIASTWSGAPSHCEVVLARLHTNLLTITFGSLASLCFCQCGRPCQLGTFRMRSMSIERFGVMVVIVLCEHFPHPHAKCGINIHRRACCANRQLVARCARRPWSPPKARWWMYRLPIRVRQVEPNSCRRRLAAIDHRMRYCFLHLHQNGYQKAR